MAAGEEWESQKEVPFAELWMGDHVNGPSHVVVDELSEAIIGKNEQFKMAMGAGEKSIPVSELTLADPQRFLGEGYEQKYPYANKNLACLFKVLSVRTALSIQAHPNRAAATLLNEERPDIYKDKNPKAEVAIALSNDFSACFGFASPEKIRENLASVPALAKLTDSLTGLNPTANDFPGVSPEFLENFTKALFYKLDKDHDELEKVVGEI
jgi:mannose-6-phosphate isomerase